MLDMIKKRWAAHLQKKLDKAYDEQMTLFIQERTNQYIKEAQVRNNFYAKELAELLRETEETKNPDTQEQNV